MGIEYNNNIRIPLVRDPGFTSKPYSSTRGRPSRSLSFVQYILVMKQDLHSLFCLNIEVTLSLPGRRLESQRRLFVHLPSSRLPAPGKNSLTDYDLLDSRPLVPEQSSMTDFKFIKFKKFAFLVSL